MKLKKIFALGVGLFVLTTFSALSAAENKQELEAALSAIGVSQSEIDTVASGGRPSKDFLQKVVYYAENSNSGAFKGLSRGERDALVVLCIKINQKGALSNSDLQTLMEQEKMRAGLSADTISQLATITRSLRQNPDYVINSQQATVINDIALPVIENPYAFSDCMGDLVTLAKEENPLIAEATNQAILEGAQELLGLSGNQVQNITNISNTYQETGEFDNSQSNVSDVNAMLGASALFGSAILFSAFDEDTVYGMEGVTDNHYNNFDADGASRFHNDLNNNRRANGEGFRNGDGARGDRGGEGRAGGGRGGEGRGGRGGGGRGR